MENIAEQAKKYKNIMLDALDYFWKNPETGYKEYKTEAYLKHAFEKLGYSVTAAGNIPGFYADADTGRPGPTVAVMAELDGLLCPTHPDADPETGAVHCCGHGAQLAALLGVAAVLKELGALDGFSGKIRLMAVPAEELIEIPFRQRLKEQGIIRYFGGKVELLYRGWFDSVDIAMMIHTTNAQQTGGYIYGGGNGCIVKEYTFEGVTAHAGGAPHQGINALYAANLAMNAVNALRETFQDADHIRFHPIITAGGDSVNAIPDVVKMEAYVRGADINAIVAANERINRAAAASAAAMGARLRIRDILGYHPIRNASGLIPVMEQAMKQTLGNVTVEPGTIRAGCSDVGDLSALMPMIHPYVSGASGKSHGSDYVITDPDTAVIGSAQVQLQFLKLLLQEDARQAKAVIQNYQPLYSSKEEYFEKMDRLNMDIQAVTYRQNHILLQTNKDRIEWSKQ